jgi:hypothetical protein
MSVVPFLDVLLTVATNHDKLFLLESGLISLLKKLIVQNPTGILSLLIFTRKCILYNYHQFSEYARNS